MNVCENEFLRREGILAVDPGYSFYSGTGWAYFENGKLKHCGLVKPFAAGYTSTRSILEVLQKLSRKWEEVKGYSIRPRILCLESPVNYANYTRRINTNVLGQIQFLNGMLSERFKPQELLRPTPSTWKGNKPKEKHHVEIISSLDSYSIKRLEEDLAQVPPGSRHNVIDAVGLGLYCLAFEQDLINKNEPALENFRRANMG